VGKHEGRSPSDPAAHFDRSMLPLVLQLQPWPSLQLVLATSHTVDAYPEACIPIEHNLFADGVVHLAHQAVGMGCLAMAVLERSAGTGASDSGSAMLSMYFLLDSGLHSFACGAARARDGVVGTARSLSSLPVSGIQNPSGCTATSLEYTMPKRRRLEYYPRYATMSTDACCCRYSGGLLILRSDESQC
jgi:hypothetical protein